MKKSLCLTAVLSLTAFAMAQPAEMPATTQPAADSATTQPAAVAEGATTAATTQMQLAQGEQHKTASGLTIVTVSTPKDAPAAKDGDALFVAYRGRLADGTEFDASQPGSPLPLRLGKTAVIAGWTEGLRGMKLGDKRQLVIPPALGYKDEEQKDETGKVIIPANSTLIFDVELVGLIVMPPQ